VHTLIKKTWDAALVNRTRDPGQFDPLFQEAEAILAQHPGLAIEIDAEKISGSADDRLRRALRAAKKIGKFLTIRLKGQKDRVFIVSDDSQKAK
jgi:hypothetical protein